MKRQRMKKHRSRKVFRQGAKRIHGKNHRPRPMRGGYRL